MIPFGQRLQEIRRLQCMPLSMLAKETEIAKARIAGIEDGTVSEDSVTIGELKSFSLVLNRPLWELVYDVEPNK